MIQFTEHLAVILTKIMKQQFCNQGNVIEEIPNTKELSAILKIKPDEPHLEFEKHWGFLRLNNADMDKQLFDNDIFFKNRDFIKQNYLNMDALKETTLPFICVFLEQGVPLEYYVSKICYSQRDWVIKYFGRAPELERRIHALLQHRPFLVQHGAINQIKCIVNAAVPIGKSPVIKFWNIFK